MIRTGRLVFGAGLLLAAVVLPLAASARADRAGAPQWVHVNHYHDTLRHGWRGPVPSHKDRKRVDAAYWRWHREHVRVYGYAPHPCRTYGPPRHRHGR